ncbi:hypothetical protein Tco_1122271 [Tanacetum coccineum]|uniref:Retrotransposon gag domain-containing protein n=1 Tax=Tanacetum coccineum TaxID=301880 RepID=A0ABQ5J131_9ASTR
MASAGSDRDAKDALSKLLQMGTVAEYHNEFEILINRVTGISQSLLTLFYISGLKVELQRKLWRSRPTTLGEYFSLARVAEAKFEESVKNRIGPSKYEDPKGALSKLFQLGMVDDYQREFEKLTNRVTDIPDSLLISFYISGLKLHLQRELLVSKPTILGDVFSLARTIDARFNDQVAPVAGSSAGLKANKVVNDGDDSESSGPVTPTSDSESSDEVKVLNWVQQTIDVESTSDNVGRDQASELEMKVLVDGVGINKNNKRVDKEVQYSVRTLPVLIPFLERPNDQYIKKKNMEVVIQRRLWDPGIKIFFRHHLEGNVVFEGMGSDTPVVRILS